MAEKPERTERFSERHLVEQLEPEYDIQAEVEANKEQNLQNDDIEEQNAEEEITTLRYREADALIRDEIKETIKKKEMDKVTVAVLSGQKNIVMEQMRQLQATMDQVRQETEESFMKSEIETDELHQLQERFLYNGEIVNKLENFTKTLQERYKQVKLRREQCKKQLEDQKKDLDLITYSEKRISDLKAEIKKKKASRNCGKGTERLNRLREDKLALTTKPAKERHQLDHAKQQFEDFKLKEENLKELQREKQRQEEILRARNQKLQELQLLHDQNLREFSERTKERDIVLKENSNKLKESLEKAAELKMKVEEGKEEYQKLRNVLNSKEKCHTELNEKIAEISSKIKDRKEELEGKAKKFEEEVQTVQEEQKKGEDKVTAIMKENEELSCHLEASKQQYVSVIEEKCEKLSQKGELEQKLGANKALKVQIKLVQEEIGIKQKASEELTQKIADLSSDKRLQELEKQKAYVVSTTAYLTDKKENIKKQVEDKKVEVNNKKESVMHQMEVLQEKRKLHENLIKELEDFITKKDVESPGPSSILKSPASHKKFPMSPKKVQFEGVSSYESSGSSETTVIVEQTIVGKSLDEILKEMQDGRTFKKPTAVKKRKIDIE